MTPLSGRIRAIDWFRGLAVLVMVQAHAVNLLAADQRLTSVFRWLDRLHGLVAPAFLFAAGLSLGLRQSTTRPVVVVAKKRLRRIAEVLATATFINTLWFPVLRDPMYLLRLDILHCVGLSLLLGLAVVQLTRRWPAVSVSVLGLATAAIFAVSPLFESTPLPWSLFVNTKSGALFPLLPWSGHLLAGAAVGVAAGHSRRGLSFALLGLLAICGAVVMFTLPLRAAYPPHDIWVTNPANAAERLGLVVALALALVLLEPRVSVHSPLTKVIERFGSASLSAYVIHLLVLFYPGSFCVRRFFHDLTLAQLAPVLIAVWVTTYVLVGAWQPMSSALWGRWLRVASPSRHGSPTSR